MPPLLFIRGVGQLSLCRKHPIRAAYADSDRRERLIRKRGINEEYLCGNLSFDATEDQCARCLRRTAQ